MFYFSECISLIIATNGDPSRLKVLIHPGTLTYFDAASIYDLSFIAHALKFTEESIEGNDLATSLIAYIAFKYDGRKKKPEKKEPKPEPFMEVEKVLVRKLGCRCDPPCTSYLSMNCYLVN